jgi:inner membrane protein
MATVFTHAAAALALGTAFRRPGPPLRFWLAGAACAMAPDLDVIGLSFGVPWGHVLGHRGLTHSLAFASVLVTVVMVAAFRGPAWEAQRGRLWLFLFVATASHGVLDAMTDGGSGVAFWAPFDDGRSSVAAIPVSPIGRRFFTARGAWSSRASCCWCGCRRRLRGLCGWAREAGGGEWAPALVFDLDGTLTDPLPGIAGCLRYALGRLDRPVPTTMRSASTSVHRCAAPSPPCWGRPITR